jgi:hypothetical protein
MREDRQVIRERLRTRILGLVSHVPTAAEATDRIIVAVDLYLLDQRRCHLGDDEEDDIPDEIRQVRTASQCVNLGRKRKPREYGRGIQCMTF